MDPKETTEIISDKEFDNLFAEEKTDVKPNAFNTKAGISDMDILLDNDKGSDDGGSAKTEEQIKLEQEAKDKNDIDDLLNADTEEEDEEETTNTSTVFKALEGLVEKGILQVFVDDDGKPLKDLKEYTEEELVELITDNIETAIESTAESAPLELFKTFPKSVQDVITYTLKGGKEEQLKGLFQQLAQVQDTLDLNPEDEGDARKIIKQYLELENIHSPEEIEDQITKIEDLGKLLDYSTKYKKVLDTKQAAILKKRIADQEIIADQQKAKDLEINKKIYDTLTTPLEGLDLDVETRKGLYYGLVQKKHQNEKGEPINELEHLIKQKMSGTKQDAELLIKTFAYLKSPETFIQSLEKNIKAKIQKEITNEIKDGNSRNATTNISSTQTNSSKKKLSGLPKKANFFARN